MEKAKMNLDKITPFIFPSILLMVSLIVAVIFVLIATARALTNLEGVLLQLFTLGLGLVGSYLIGKISSKKTAIEIIKPHARSSFRRLLSLYNSLSRMAALIQATTEKKNSKSAELTLEKIDSIVIEQITTADDALEDWRDIIPEEVEDILKRIKNK